MCGILFQVTLGGGELVSQDRFRTMLTALAHRGPDGESVYRRDRTLLGHRRLSIIDIAGGTQPIFNENGDLACILNGEIYNYRDLKDRLTQVGHVFRTDSDTEVIVHLYEEYGDAFVNELDGMFGLVLADYSRDRYLVARDRLGEKSVYYSLSNGRLTCASEAVALLDDNDLGRHIDRKVLANFLARGVVSGTDSIWQGVARLGPGQLMVIDRGSTVSIKSYWKPVRQARKRPLRQLVHETREALERAMENKLVADVPVGVFLSGGLDSSVVTALAARTASQPLKTFSVGFKGAHSELSYAREVAVRYRTDHTEIEVSLDLERDLPLAFAAYDEPFFDSSALPTYLISREASRHVKVILTGDGGDELFAGYSAYLDQANQYQSRLLSALARRARFGARGTRLSGLTMALPVARLKPEAALRRWRSIRGVFDGTQIAKLLPGSGMLVDDSDIVPEGLDRMTPLDVALADDLAGYLPDDLLVKVDRASMANGLECRAPLLDHHLVEFMMTVPSQALMADGMTKYLLRSAVRDLLPQSIIEREKQGFGSPLVAWMKGPLRQSIRSLSARGSVLRELLEPEALDILVQERLSCLESDWRAPLQLWTLLSLQSWAEIHLRRSSAQHQSFGT